MELLKFPPVAPRAVIVVGLTSMQLVNQGDWRRDIELVRGVGGIREAARNI